MGVVLFYQDTRIIIRKLVECSILNSAVGYRVFNDSFIEEAWCIYFVPIGISAEFLPASIRL
jgi:hypothetical protein